MQNTKINEKKETCLSLAQLDKLINKYVYVYTTAKKKKDL
jgi:hypothetical protein